MLSPAGRLTLISSILSNLSIYYLSVFKIPVSVSKRLQSLLTHFWWAGTRNRKTIHWCSKITLGIAKSKGGLGIRNLQCLNKALLAKQAWKFLKEPSFKKSAHLVHIRFRPPTLVIVRTVGRPATLRPPRYHVVREFWKNCTYKADVRGSSPCTPTYDYVRLRLRRVGTT